MARRTSKIKPKKLVVKSGNEIKIEKKNWRVPSSSPSCKDMAIRERLNSRGHQSQLKYILFLSFSILLNTEVKVNLRSEDNYMVISD